MSKETQTQLNTEESIRDYAATMATARKEMDLELMQEGVSTLTKAINENGSLAKSAPNAYAQLKDARGHTAWYVLDRIDMALFEELFSEYFQYALEIEPELLLSMVQTQLSVLISFDERDAVKKKIRAAMTRSTATIGEENIESAGQMVEPTVGYWLRDWHEFVADRKVDALAIVEYLNTSKNVQKLNDEDRKRLEELIKFDQQMSYPSDTAEGSVDRYVVRDPQSGTYKFYDRGALKDTGVPIDEEELEAMRYVEGLDESGKALSFADIVRREARYAQPETVGEVQEQDKDTPSAPVQKQVASVEDVLKESTATEVIQESEKEPATSSGAEPTAPPSPKPKHDVDVENSKTVAPVQKSGE